MGRFQIQVEIMDLELESFEQLDAWVDDGPGHLTVPAPVLEQLGYAAGHRRRFMLPDGGEALVSTSRIAARIGGQIRVVPCVFGDSHSEARLGANTLQKFNLEVDAVDETLVPMKLRLPSFRLIGDKGRYVYSNN